MMMSPYGSKTAQKSKGDARTYRMQTLTASKMQSTNLLNSNAKQTQKNRFELPLLSNRSSSKPTLALAKNPLSVTKVPTTQATCLQMTTTQSHNFLPSKIGCGVISQQPLAKPGQQNPTMLTAKTNSVARLYSSNKEPQSMDTTPTGSSTGTSMVGPAALKMSAQKSPGNTFKHTRNAQSAAQMTTLAGGVRKQNFGSKV